MIVALLLLSGGSGGVAAGPTSNNNKLRAAEHVQLAVVANTKSIEEEAKKDRETLADSQITTSEYAEASIGATHMHRSDGDQCGHAYCNDLTEYKPIPMATDDFIGLCIEAHRDWEKETQYSLSCDPQNPVRLKAEASEQLRVRTMKLIDDRRDAKYQKKSGAYASDSAAAAREGKKHQADIQAGVKQRQAGTLLAQKIDIKKHVTDKRDALKIQVRCKNGAKVASVYEAGASGQRIPNCPPDVVKATDMAASQGYQVVVPSNIVDEAVTP